MEDENTNAMKYKM